MNFIRKRGTSLSMVVLVLLVISAMQDQISFSTTFGRLAGFIGVPDVAKSALPAAWLAVRAALSLAVVALWFVNRKRALFKMIVIATSVLTAGLAMNMAALVDVLLDLSAQAVAALIFDVILLAVTNVLIFSIWYWIIDPPGVEETLRMDEPWDFLFPQRSVDLPHYEDWLPRYSDYLFLAFTTSVAFSPTDTMPLTRRAKMLMLLQSTISLVTATGIVGAAINILAGSG